MRAIKTLLGIGLATALLPLVQCEHRSGTLRINDRERVPVEHSSLYLEVRGERETAPVLLWLHGGPGGAERPLFETFNGDLERSFRVAYYDQRGTGRSFDPDAPEAALTISQHLADLEVVIDRLKDEQRVNQVILVGHSWGSLLGLLYAQRHPADVAAFVGISQVVAPLEDQREEYRFVARSASPANDRSALARLEAIGPPPFDGKHALDLGKLVDRYGGTWHRPPSYLGTLVRATIAGFVSPFEIAKFIRANERSLAAMTPELLRVDLRRKTREVPVPTIFFLGRFDHQISIGTAQAYWRSTRSPSKSLRLFGDSAHNIPFEEPEAFSACLKTSLAEEAGLEVVRHSEVPCPYPVLEQRNRSTSESDTRAVRRKLSARRDG